LPLARRGRRARLERLLALVEFVDRRIEDRARLGCGHRSQFLDEGLEILLVTENQAWPEPAIPRTRSWGRRAPALDRQRCHATP